MQEYNEKRNPSHMMDTVPYEVIKHEEQEIKKEEKKIKRLVYRLKGICELNGYEITNRIELKNIKSGKIWK